jgi:peptide/nickel transport system substrate-binding protein
MKRISLFYIIVTTYCIIILTFLKCGENKNDSRLDNNTVIVGCGGDERVFFQEYSGDEATYLMFLRLVMLEGEEYGEPQPALAERWEHSDDYRSWTFFLRKDVRWHDGEPVTAHDVKFTLDLRDRQFNELGNGLFRNVILKDDYTVTVTYNKPTDGLDTYDVYYPKHLLENLDPDKINEWEFWKQPVGNGPYKYVRHVPKTMVEVEANPDYYRGKPKIERVILKFLSGQLHFVELLSGNIDAQSYTNRDILLKLSGDDRFHFYHWWGSRIAAIYWNHRNPLFSNPAIRRALTMAINRKEFGEVLNYPEGVPIIDVITTRRQFQRKLYPEPYPYDPDKALKILEEAGWRDSDDNGILDKNGKEFRFALNTGSGNRTAVFIQDQLKRIGIHMDIQMLAGGVISQRAAKGEFDAIHSTIINETLQPLGGHIKIFGEDSPLGYKNAEMIRLLNLAGDTIDPDEKDRIYEKIMPIFYEDLPVTLLLPNVQTHIVHKRIKGLISPYRAEPVCNMEYLWIEEEKQ